VLAAQPSCRATSIADMSPAEMDAIGFSVAGHLSDGVQHRLVFLTPLFEPTFSPIDGIDNRQLSAIHPPSIFPVGDRIPALGL
jgi:hypothetical protein